MSSESTTTLLCQMVQRREVYYAAGLRSEHFPEGPARRLYGALGAIYESLLAADSFILREKLDDSTYGWYVENVRNAVPSAANWSYYRDRVVADYRRRRIAEILEEAKARLGDADVNEWMMHELAGVEDATGADLVDQSEFVGEYSREIERRRKESGKTPGIPTGIAKLDGLLHGLQKRRLILVGARPSQGKTALMTSLTANIARQARGVGIVSLESSRYELTERIVSNLAGVDNESLATGRITHEEQARIDDARMLMQSDTWNVRISDNPYLTIDGVRARIREMVVAYGVEIVFLDYVQRIREKSVETPFRLHIAQCSGELKSLAEDLNVPVVALAQLGRDADGHRARLSHFKESGQLEQDADSAILIGRNDDGSVFLDVAKNRDGRKGHVPVKFAGQYMRFSGVEDE